MENELESEVIRAKGGSHEAFVNLIKPLELQMYNTARAIVKKDFRDLPLRQVAELLDLSEGAVKTRLHRARTALYEWLGDYGERKMNL